MRRAVGEEVGDRLGKLDGVPVQDDGAERGDDVDDGAEGALAVDAGGADDVDGHLRGGPGGAAALVVPFGGEGLFARPAALGRHARYTGGEEARGKRGATQANMCRRAARVRRGASHPAVCQRVCHCKLLQLAECHVGEEGGDWVVALEVGGLRAGRRRGL